MSRERSSTWLLYKEIKFSTWELADRFLAQLLYWAPKETIHSKYWKLFYSKHKTVKHVVRNVILNIFYKLWISEKDVDVDPPSVTWGSIYKITRLQKVHYFFIWTPYGRKVLNNWIHLKEQMYHTLIVQKEETWTWRNFRSNPDCVPPFRSIEKENHF